MSALSVALCSVLSEAVFIERMLIPLTKSFPARRLSTHARWQQVHPAVYATIDRQLLSRI